MCDLVRKQRAELVGAECEQQRGADVQMIAVAAEYAPTRNLLDADLEVAVDLHRGERHGDDLA
jgi:hypothetical protein